MEFPLYFKVSPNNSSDSLSNFSIVVFAQAGLFLRNLRGFRTICSPSTLRISLSPSLRFSDETMFLGDILRIFYLTLQYGSFRSARLAMIARIF